VKTLNFSRYQTNSEVIKIKGGIPYWVIAAHLGVHENTVRNWMKQKLDVERKTKILTALKEIKLELEIHEGQEATG